MKKQFNLSGDEYLSFQDRPLVADDVNAYELVYTSKHDLSNYSVMVTAFRPDGSTVQDVGTTSGNTATVLLKTNMYEQTGELRVRISIVSESGTCLTTKEIVFDVVEGNGDNAIKGSDNYPVLVSLIAQVKELQSENSAAKLKAYTDNEVEKAVHVLKNNISNSVGNHEKTSPEIVPGMTADAPYTLDAECGISRAEITILEQTEGNPPCVELYKDDTYLRLITLSGYPAEKIIIDRDKYIIEFISGEEINTLTMTDEEVYSMMEANAVELYTTDGADTIKAVFSCPISAKTYTDECVNAQYLAGKQYTDKSVGNALITIEGDFLTSPASLPSSNYGITEITIEIPFAQPENEISLTLFNNDFNTIGRCDLGKGFPEGSRIVIDAIGRKTGYYESTGEYFDTTIPSEFYDAMMNSDVRVVHVNDTYAMWYNCSLTYKGSSTDYTDNAIRQAILDSWEDAV